MPGRAALLLTAVWLGVGPAGVPSAAAQPRFDDGVRTTYWHSRQFAFPIETAQVADLKKKASEIRLYVSNDRRPFKLYRSLSPARLDELNGGRVGFQFDADRDGEFAFAVQLVQLDGTVLPDERDLFVEQRVVIDSQMPTVRVFPSGNSVEWEITDENLDPASVRVEHKWPSQPQWFPVTAKTFQPKDSHTWPLRAGDVVEVRVKAKDRAGHEGISRVVRLPPREDGRTDPIPGRNPDTFASRPGGTDEPRPPVRFGQPEIFYVNNMNVDVQYTIARMGRSGIQAAHLYVSKNQINWEFAKQVEVKKAYDPKGAELSIPYTAEKEGLYGFIVQPESGAGNKAPEPREGDSPMVLVEVDTTPPYARLTGVRVTPGGTKGPLVEFSWTAEDRNLMARPVNLEYATTRDATEWKPIALQIENNLSKQTGRFVWEVTDPDLWKFYVRLRVTDKATNTAQHLWGETEESKVPKEVIVDLVTPDSAIKSVRPVGSGGSGSPPVGRPSVTPSPKGKGPNVPSSLPTPFDPK